MKVFKNLNEIEDIADTVVALGNFDGIHLGHKALIDEAVKIAKIKGLKSAIFTFSNHPKNVMANKIVVKNIIYDDDKVKLLEYLGVDYLFSLEFNKSMMTISPDDFAKKLLHDKFKANTAICGFNFRFGHKALGNSNVLKKLGEIWNFNVIVKDPIKVDGNIVSSTLIREMIALGNVEEASRLLGRQYSIRGMVIHGNHIGRTMGFPTCNIAIDEYMVSLPNGVYVTKCKVGTHKYPSMTNVGNKPTVGNFARNIETHILDFDHDLYDKFIQVEFLKQTRREIKFSGLSQLQEQLKADVREARHIHLLPEYMRMPINHLR